MAKKERYYEKGYSYFLKDPELKYWDYTYHIHKNKNGAHFDLRLFCPGGTKSVYSWSSKRHLLDKSFPTPIRRTKDHKISWLSFEGSYISPAGAKNTLKIIERGSAELINLDSDSFVFKTKDRIFKLKHLKGKRYLFIPLEGLVK